MSGSNAASQVSGTHLKQLLFDFFLILLSLTTAYGSLGRHVSHRACTKVRHSALSAALCAASAHDVHPNASRSFPAILRHVSFGLPIALFPTGVQCITIRQSFVFSNRRIWPIKLHLLALMMSVISCLFLPLHTVFRLKFFFARIYVEFDANIYCEMY